MREEQREVELAAPGAGLPWMERAVSGVLLAGYSAWVPKEKILARFRRESETAIALVQSLDETAASTPVLISRPIGLEDSSRHWSAAMTLEHLVIVDLGIAGIIRALTASQPQAGLEEVRIQDVKPSAGAGLEQIGQLRNAVEIYSETVTPLGDLRSKTRHPHPWFGPLDARGWHALAAIHSVLHRRQLEAIVTRLSRVQ